MLHEQLKDLGLVIKQLSKFNTLYRLLWFENGDNLSSLYTNRQAMKGDFTKFGKRKYSGVIYDGILSIKRYYYGFIVDYYQQVVIGYLMGDIDKFSFYLYESTLENTDPNITRKKEILKNILIVKLLNLDADERIKGSWWVRFTFKVGHYCGASLIDIVMIVSSICTYLVQLNDEENIERYWRITNDTIEQVVHSDYFTDAATRLLQDSCRNQGILLPFQVSSLGACNFGHRQAPSTLHGTKAPTEGTTLCGVAVKFPFQATPDTRAHALEQLQKHYRHARFSAGPIETLQRAKHNTSVFTRINRKIKHCLWFC